MTFPTLVTNEDFQFYPFKLIRLIHWDRLFLILNFILDKILAFYGISKSKMKDMMSLISLFLFISFATHVLACIWVFLGRQDQYNPKRFDEDFVSASWVYN